MHQKFRSFVTKNEQDAYLQGLIEVCTIKRRRVRKRPIERSTGALQLMSNDSAEENEPLSSTDENHLRDKQFKYRINTSTNSYVVCQKAFSGIHSITQKRVRRLYELLKNGISPNDERGKNKPGNAKSADTILTILNHINSFPRKQTHYASRVHEFLNERLNIAKMFTMYKQDNPTERVNYYYYYYLKIFREHFSLSFGRPQVDTCLTCEEYSVKLKSKELNDTAKRVAAAEKMVHERRAKKFYTKKNYSLELYKDDDDVAIISIDFMQNLQLPEVPIQSAFYLRQLTVNCFCIHNEKTGCAKLYVYHEGIGGKGPNEVCLFLKQYLDDKTYIPKTARKLFVFSDGCGGQNRNHTVLRFFCMLAETGRFSVIHHYFPKRGHSFLSCDRDFAIIKRILKKADRIYSLREYIILILEANRMKTKRFHVQKVTSTDILNFNTWWKLYYKKNTISIETKGKHVPKEDKRTLKISQYSFIIHLNDQASFWREISLMDFRLILLI